MLPAPLQPLDRHLTPAHREVLIMLQALYPKGLTDKSWCADFLGQADLATLLRLWKLKRPEENPPAPIWQVEREQIADLPCLSKLLGSLEALQTFASLSGGRVPQWITAAWWWSHAVVVCETTPDSLKYAVDGWATRYRCALMYVQRKEVERDPVIGNAYQNDLTCSNSWPLPSNLDEAWALRLGFDWNRWQLPSQLQPWGELSEQGKVLRVTNPEPPASGRAG
jgi:hypothetical protein